MQLNWGAIAPRLQYTAIEVYASSKRISPDIEPDTRCRRSPGGSGRCIRTHDTRCGRVHSVNRYGLAAVFFLSRKTIDTG